jgi:GNAT superfamily N-acetyltransferase
MPEILQATVADAEDILTLQKLAYQREAALYDDYNIAPLTQTLAEMQKDFGKNTILKAVADGKIVGSVRAYQDQNACFIGRLMVHPDFQGRGIGAELMQRIEAIFPNVRSYQLFTGYKSAGNIRLYERLGYSKVRKEGILLFMQKNK